MTELAIAELNSSRASYDLDFATATPLDFAQALAVNSFVVLRGALAAPRLSWFLSDIVQPAIEFWHRNAEQLLERADIIERLAQYPGAPGTGAPPEVYRSLSDLGYVTDRMLRVASDDRHSLYELISEPRLWSMIGAAMHGARLESSIVAHVRTIQRTKAGDDWEIPLQLHFDYYYHHEVWRFGVNVWCPFSDAGPQAGAPTLAVVQTPLREAIEWLFADNKPADIAREGFFDTVLARFGANSLVPLELKLGDIVVLTNWTLHKTHIEPSMTRGRTSAEVRILAAEEAFQATRFPPSLPDPVSSPSIPDPVNRRKRRWPFGAWTG